MMTVVVEISDTSKIQTYASAKGFAVRDGVLSLLTWTDSEDEDETVIAVHASGCWRRAWIVE